MNLEYLMMWYCIRYFQYEVLWYCSSLSCSPNWYFSWIPLRSNQEIWYSLLPQQNRYVQGFTFCFPSSRNWNIYLYIVTFSSCHYCFPQLEWYAELLGLHCSAWLLLFAICATLLGFFWLQWWLFCCMCVYIIVTFTNDLFTFYTLIYIDYISFF